MDLRKTISIVAVVLLLALGGWIIFQRFQDEKEAGLPTLKTAIEKVEDNEISKINVSSQEQAVILTDKDKKTTKKYGIPNVEGPYGLEELLKAADKKNVPVVAKPIPLIGGEGPLNILIRLIPTFLLIGLLVAFAYMSKLGPFGRVKVAPETTDVSFDDVAGCDEAIEELKEVEMFLGDPSRFKHLGARVPQGVLLYGPPGTGKTLLAKALATEANVPFYATSGSEFIEMYAGLGARRVRQLFENARENAPSIIFIDELDAIGGERSSGGPGDGGTREADQTINEILKQMDGFGSERSKPVIVIGATNRLESLDPAIVRPGRFDRQISIDAPDKGGRLDILKVHSGDKTFAEDVDLDRVAIQTAGMTGADLSRLMNESALYAARRGGESICAEDIDDAYFRVVAGAKKQSRLLTKAELERVAYHETGHAIIGEVLPGANVVHKISIIPRGKSGGQTLYVSEEDVFLHSEEYLKDNICSLLGGRAAEELIYDNVSSGAADDLKRTTALSVQMMLHLGMSKSLGLRVNSDEVALSANQRNALDQEIKELLEEQYSRAKAILLDHKDILETIKEKLLKEEVIDRPQFLAIIDPTADPEEENDKDTTLIAPEI